MKKKKGMPQLSFKAVVETTEDIADGYRKDLTALGQYSSKVEVSTPRLLQGSVDIDACTIAKYPNANRWDYAFAYNSEVFFIEVHPANSGEVRIVLKKLQWLKDWLHTKAPEINRLKAKKTFPFYWIQSKNFSIPKTSPQYRAAEGAGLRPISKLKL